MNYHFITIEGNIGAGKTTLAHLLSKHYNARLILEQFADNPFLPKFYDNPKTIMQIPKPATHNSMMRPWFFFSGLKVSSINTTTDPNAGAERSIPNP